MTALEMTVAALATITVGGIALIVWAIKQITKR